jgi:hypothetical protein
MTKPWMVPMNSVAAASLSSEGGQLAAGLAFPDETMQAFAVALDQGLHHALGRVDSARCKLAKHHPWHARVLDATNST